MCRCQSHLRPGGPDGRRDRIGAQAQEVPLGGHDVARVGWDLGNGREADGRAGSHVGACPSVRGQRDHRLNAPALSGGRRHQHLGVDHLIVGAGRRRYALLHPDGQVAQGLLEDAVVAHGDGLGGRVRRAAMIGVVGIPEAEVVVEVASLGGLRTPAVPVRRPREGRIVHQRPRAIILPWNRPLWIAPGPNRAPLLSPVGPALVTGPVSSSRWGYLGVPSGLRYWSQAYMLASGGGIWWR